MRTGVKAWVWVAAGVAVLAMTAVPALAANVLEAKKVDAGPTLDGTLKPIWQRAKPLSVNVAGGKNLDGGKTTVNLRALYTSEMIYLLVQYKDPTQSFRRSPWVKQADGSWKQLKDPNDKGGDNNLYYEDKVAIQWAIKAPTFEKTGCMSGCHVGEGKPFGNKYTPAGELNDMWHWKSVRTGSVGQVDDQYVDSTKYDKEKFPEAGRKSDPKTGGGYADNVNADKTGPKFALKGNVPAPPYWIIDSEKEAFDGAKYKPGDEVPGIIVAPFTGDRGDIAAASTWKDGMWTVEIGRKLVTGSEFDVQFNDMKKKYAFGIVVFDNAQVRHAFHPGAQQLTFGE